MEDLEEIKQLKQNFLKKEIIEKGFDPEHFLQYLREIKDDASNIDSWIITELEKVVVDYRAEPEIFFSRDSLEVKNKVSVFYLDHKDFVVKTAEFEVWRNMN